METVKEKMKKQKDIDTTRMENNKRNCADDDGCVRFRQRLYRSFPDNGLPVKCTSA